MYSAIWGNNMGGPYNAGTAGVNYESGTTFSFNVSLLPGTYYFKIQASNNDGEFSYYANGVENVLTISSGSGSGTGVGSGTGSDNGQVFAPPNWHISGDISFGTPTSNLPVEDTYTLTGSFDVSSVTGDGPIDYYVIYGNSNNGPYPQNIKADLDDGTTYTFTITVSAGYWYFRPQAQSFDSSTLYKAEGNESCIVVTSGAGTGTGNGEGTGTGNGEGSGNGGGNAEFPSWNFSGLFSDGNGGNNSGVIDVYNFDLEIQRLTGRFSSYYVTPNIEVSFDIYAIDAYSGVVSSDALASAYNIGSTNWEFIANGFPTMVDRKLLIQAYNFSGDTKQTADSVQTTININPENY